MRLNVILTDADLAQILAALPPEGEISQLAAFVQPGSVRITGHWRRVVPFVTLWTLAVAGSRLTATLASVSVVGLPMLMVKSIVVNHLVGLSPRVTVQGDSVSIDLSQPWVALNLTDVTCAPGEVRVSG